MLFSLHRPSDERLERIVRAEASAALTYPDVGASVREEHPPGYRVDGWEADLGADADDRFDRCAESVLAWGAQRGVGIGVFPDKAVAVGETFALVLPLPLGYVIATARVVHVVNDTDQVGFAYGTLPAHPEEGEEIFVVRRRGDRVTFEVRAFSRPRDRLARLGSPVTRWLQLRTNRGYLSALKQVANTRQ